MQATTAAKPLCSALAAALLLAPAASAEAASEAREAFEARQAKLAALGDSGGEVKSLAATVFHAGFESSEAAGGSTDCSTDSDGDGLPDCAETATGVFVDAWDTGTDPNLADTDGDGISDGEEVLGTETGLDLAALGASPLRRDLLIEYDWFESDLECGPHSQRPTAAAMARVARIFAGAPVTNPDGSTGIHLIQDAGQGGALSGGNRVDGFDPVLPGRFDDTFYDIKAANFDPARLGYFRYVLLPHRYDGGSDSAGYAEVVGDDAIVSLQCQATEDYLTRVIAHELGHLLGLMHGGFENCNHKPNYNSLMNYRYIYAGTDADCDGLPEATAEGFSSGARAAIDEAAIDEHAGMCGSPAIDFNGDGQLQTGLAHDLNPDSDVACGAALAVLEDFDDWSNLRFFGIREHEGQLKSIQTEVDCAAPPPPRRR